MAPINSARASVYWNGVKVAKIRNINIQVSRGALDTTGIGEMDGTAAYGIRQTTASGTLMYDPTNTATVALMNRIFSDSEVLDELRIQSSSASAQGDLTGQVVINSNSVPIQVGELITCDISFTVSGGLSGAY